MRMRYSQDLSEQKYTMSASLSNTPPRRMYDVRTTTYTVESRTLTTELEKERENLWLRRLLQIQCLN